MQILFKRLQYRIFSIQTKRDSIFTVSLVGKPNVGKSSLFNVLAGDNLALVDPMPGLTRDRK